MDIGTAARERILNLCKARHITVNKLSTICVLTQSTLNNIVSDRNKSVTISTLKKICDGLDMTIQEFFDDAVFYNLEQEIQ